MNKDSHWNDAFDVDLPFWAPYRELLGRRADPRFPDIAALNALLPRGCSSGGGKPLQFVLASQVPNVAYERHIFETGEVSTRENNWHDLFNALVWCRLPRLKAALNALHYGQLDLEHEGRRGVLRDALTLLDESGVIVLGRDRTVLQALAARDWQDAFRNNHEAWKTDMRVVVCGHGLLEKFLQPYKAMTAHALLCHAEEPFFDAPGEHLPDSADASIAQLLLEGALQSGPENLSPLPLMGIPAWWPEGAQDPAFYADTQVFRPAPVQFQPAPVHSL
jgi:hypothetical protein